MPLQVLTRSNMVDVSKATGWSVDFLLKRIIDAAINDRPCLVRVPMPKHLRCDNEGV